MGFNDINLQVSGPVQPASIYKTKVLKGQVPFATQVTEPNTKYVIKHNFVLNGDVTIPENCILEFDGGCLSNGTLNFNSTKIVSDSKCFSTDINFGTGHITNEEVLISWFVDENNIMKEPDDTPTHDCHDEIKAASSLAGHISSGQTYRNGGVLNLECLRLAVFQPIIFDQGIEGNLIKNGNIVFYSTADGQSIFHYNSSYISYCPIENCVFTYNGSVGTKAETTVGNRVYHERINAIRFEKASITAYNYWRDIKTSMLTGYVFVNQVYLQEERFKNISSSGCNGFISYNTDEYYGSTKGSSNIVTFKNCNLNNGDTTSSYYSKCTIEYLWDFYNFMELTIENAVNQGYGKTGQKAIRLGVGAYPQSVKLDGFWIEYTYGNVDNRIFIGSSTDLHIEKANVSGFVTLGNSETVNIFYNGVASNFYNSSVNFVDNSEIAEGTVQVALYYKTTTYLAHIKLSDKFLKWFDEGIIRVIDTRKYPYGSTSKQNCVTINTSCCDDWLKAKMFSAIYDSKNFDRPTTYISYYKDIHIPTLVIESESRATIYKNVTKGECSGLYYEIVYRCAPLVNVTAENIGSVNVTISDVSLFTPHVGDTAGTFTPWLRKSGINGRFGGGSIQNAKVEIAFCKVYCNYGVRDYENFYYNSTNQDLVPKPQYGSMPVIEISAENCLNASEMEQLSTYIRIDEVIIKLMNNAYQIRGAYYKSSEGLSPLKSLSGSTNSRPKAVSVGSSYFDTTLNKPIFAKAVDSSTGVVTWVDATGTTV